MRTTISVATLQIAVATLNGSLSIADRMGVFMYSESSRKQAAEILQNILTQTTLSVELLPEPESDMERARR